MLIRGNLLPEAGIGPANSRSLWSPAARRHFGAGEMCWWPRGGTVRSAGDIRVAAVRLGSQNVPLAVIPRMEVLLGFCRRKLPLYLRRS